MNQNLNEFFNEVSRVTDQTLDEVLPKGSETPQVLHEAVRWSVFAGGKRFRPALVFACGRAFGSDNEKLRRTAAAVEMVHTYSLIHDDLPAMDDDDLRRGRATCHKKFGETDAKFGEATAILAGDVLQTLAFQTIAEDESLSGEKRLALIAELARAAGTPSGMVAGQMLDIEAERQETAKFALEEIHRAKTGAMIICAARIGAIIADADAPNLAKISAYAAHIGLLFQITDDLLDVTQTTETLGKTAGKDARAEKSTYPKIYGLDKAFEKARQTHAAALDALKNLDADTQILHLIADFILQRKK